MRLVLAGWLFILGLQISVQDLVTVAPTPDAGNSPTTEVEAGTDTSSSEKPKITPTIRSLRVHSDIKYRYATTLVSSRVINPSAEAAEAAFTITLPESAFISEFLMVVKDKVYKAYVKEKEEAKKDYDQAVQAGQFAGHVALEARDSNQFTVSVNIEAHGKVTFNLTYEQLLNRNLGVYTDVINLNPQQIVDDMSVTVNIEEPTEIKDLIVPEIQISNEADDDLKENTIAVVENKSPNHKVVTWAPTPDQQKSQNSTGVSGQFIVKYDVDRTKDSQQILVDEGYFVHFFAPEDLPKLRKHVVFVLDYSGSMAGRKLEQLKDAMTKILSDLSPTDYFSIVVFQSLVEAWSPEGTYKTALNELPSWERDQVKESTKNLTLDRKFVVKASPENIESALNYLKSYTDLGATNIIGGLRTGLELVNISAEEFLNESDPPQPVVIFLTDGQPNVEEYDTNKIIDKTKILNTKLCPIFSLAFGYGADLSFLRKLSLSNSGFARNIYEAADASAQLKNFYRTVASPLLANVTFTYLPGQVDNSSNTKHEFPVFFKGSEIVVAGKIKQEEASDKKQIGELSGVAADGIKRFPIIIDFPPIIPKPVNRTTGHLEKTWAYLTIQQLLDKVDSLDDGEEKNTTKAKALELALQYAFVTPLTSLVVVKPNETSAVDTTKVNPGLGGFGDSAGGFGLSVMALPASAAYGPPSASGYPVMRKGTPMIVGGTSNSARLPAPMYPPMYPSTPANPLVQEEPIPPEAQEESMESTTLGTNSGLQKISLDQILWLQPFLANSTDSGNVVVNLKIGQYTIGINETDSTFGSCQVNNSTGECRHIKYCALNVFHDALPEYFPYQCEIPGNFMGVCCPQNIS